MSAALSPSGRDRSVARLMEEVAIAAEARSARCACTERCTTRMLLVLFIPSGPEALASLETNVSDGHLLTGPSLLSFKVRHMVRSLQK